MRLHHQLLPFAQPSLFALSASLTPTHDTLQVVFRLEGPQGELVLPPEDAQAGFRDELWKSSCFEMFTQWQDEKAYEEWNFSPSGSWAHYGFTRYRERSASPTSSGLAHAIQVQRESAHSLLLSVSIPWPARSEALPFPHTLRYGLSTVLQRRDGAYEYWALYHAASKADFHDEKSFIGEILEDRLQS